MSIDNNNTSESSYKQSVEIEVPKAVLVLYEAIAKLKGISLGQAIGEELEKNVNMYSTDGSFFHEFWTERLEKEGLAEEYNPCYRRERGQK